MAKEITMDQTTYRVRAESVELAEGEQAVTVKLPQVVPAGKLARLRVEVTASIVDAPTPPTP